MLDILKIHFLEWLKLFIRKPWIGFVLIFIWSTGFFMNKWVDSNNDCKTQLEIETRRADSLTGVVFKNMLLLQEERRQLEIERKANDSIYRVKLEEQIKELKNNVK